MKRAEKEALPFKLRPSKAGDDFIIIFGPDAECIALALDGGPSKRRVMKYARKLVETLNYGWRK